MVTDKVDLRFGVYTNAKQMTDIEERFVRAKIAADRVKDDEQKKCGFYDLGWYRIIKYICLRAGYVLALIFMSQPPIGSRYRSIYNCDAVNNWRNS